MSLFKKVIFFFILPILGILFYDPAFLGKGLPIIAVVVIFMCALGWLLMRGYSSVLTFSIFINGMNVIVRIMMLVSTAFSKNGIFQPEFTIFTFLGLAISFYMMLRLDKVDVRQTMVR